MATATQSRPAGNPYPQHAYRHHPYTQATRPQSNGPKWHTANPSTSSAASSSTAPRIHTSTPHHRVDGKKQQSPPLASTVPPSPPRSMRDASETPSAVGLGVAFGGKSGGKWWDEELPAPPASLASILDSFRKSGEGDRDLLLSILGAKKAEEERLTALIQTRLTILQARLSIHSAAASLNSYTPLTPASEAPSHPTIHRSSASPAPQERTPSLESSRSERSSFQSLGPVSPISSGSQYMPPPPVPSTSQLTSEKSGYFHLPPPTSVLRSRSYSNSSANSNPPSPKQSKEEMRLPPMYRIGEREFSARSQQSQPRSTSRPGSASPRSTGSNDSATSSSRAPGLDMLLDAGMERERRESGGSR